MINNYTGSTVTSVTFSGLHDINSNSHTISNIDINNIDLNNTNINLDDNQMLLPFSDPNKIICPDCKGTKYYVGFTKTEICVKCKGLGEI